MLILQCSNFSVKIKITSNKQVNIKSYNTTINIRKPFLTFIITFYLISVSKAVTIATDYLVGNSSVFEGHQQLNYCNKL